MALNKLMFYAGVILVGASMGFCISRGWLIYQDIKALQSELSKDQKEMREFLKTWTVAV